MNCYFYRVIVLCPLACGWCAAQPKPATGQPQPAAQQQNIPPQLYPLDELPKKKTDAEANLSASPSWNKSTPHYIWYRTAKSESTAIPVILVPMTCKKIPDEWSPQGDSAKDRNKNAEDAAANCKSNPDAPGCVNYAERFVAACIGHEKSLLTPSLPSQNRNPLKLGDGMIIAIYDKDDLLLKFHVSLVGLTVQSQNGTVLNTDPLRPTVSSSGGGAPSAAPKIGTQGLLTDHVNTPLLAPAHPEPCNGISTDGGDHQQQQPNTPFSSPLSVRVSVAEGDNVENVPVTFYVLPTNGPTGSLVGSTTPGILPTRASNDGIARANLTAGDQVGKYYVVASCPDVNGIPQRAVFDVSNISTNHYYYLPWANNPLLGDTILSVSITAQAPSPVLLTVGTNPPDLSVTVDRQTYTSTKSQTFPSGSTVPVSASNNGGYTFVRWSDGVTSGHDVAIGSSPMTLTAEFVKNGDPVPVTLLGNPPFVPLNITAGGCAAGASTVWSCPPGPITVSAPLTFPSNGITYTFQNWSDGGANPHRVTVGNEPIRLRANYSAPPPPPPTAQLALVPMTIATNPPGLWFSVNGIYGTSSAVKYFPVGDTVLLNTASPQSFVGTQYTFSNWSDSSNNSSLNRAVQLPATATTAQSYTALFTQSASAPTEQTLTLLNASYPQVHNLSRFNIATGIVASTLRSPSWTRQQVAAAVTCPTGSPQPCVPSSALYQTVPNPLSSHTVDPVLFFMIYPWRLDSERKWRPKDLRPAINLGMSLSSPSTDFFLGLSSEVGFRGVQITAGRHIGKVSELAPAGVNDPTSSAAPATVQRFHPAWFVGVTFNINFVQTLFSGAKGGG